MIEKIKYQKYIFFILNSNAWYGLREHFQNPVFEIPGENDINMHIYTLYKSILKKYFRIRGNFV